MNMFRDLEDSFRCNLQEKLLCFFQVIFFKSIFQSTNWWIIHIPLESPELAFVEMNWSKMPKRGDISASLAILLLNTEGDNVPLFEIYCLTTWQHNTFLSNNNAEQ